MKNNRGRPKNKDLINWNKIALGKFQDKVLAEKLGVSPPAVRKQRIKRGIKAFYEKGYFVFSHLKNTSLQTKLAQSLHIGSASLAMALMRALQ